MFVWVCLGALPPDLSLIVLAREGEEVSIVAHRVFVEATKQITLSV